jgi:hypothetical protein
MITQIQAAIYVIYVNLINVLYIGPTDNIQHVEVGFAHFLQKLYHGGNNTGKTYDFDEFPGKNNIFCIRKVVRVP